MPKVREWVNRNSAIVTIGAVVVLILSLGTIILSQGGRAPVRPVDVYYYDVGTGDLFQEKNTLIPPISAPSGKPGVRAYVFACGDCGDDSKRFIGWLEMYTPDAKRIMTSPPTEAENMDAFEVMERGHLISVPGNNEWVSMSSEEGFEIMDSIQNKCGEGATVSSCFPGRN